MQQFIRKNFSFILTLAIFGVVLFNPNAKAFVLRLLLGTGIFNADTKGKTDTTPAAAAPALVFIDSDGKRINTTDLKGKTIFINFWASWCPPCIAEMNSINSLYNKLKNDSSIIFILADADNEPIKATAFMNKRGYNLPVYQISEPLPADLFNGTLPTTVIIDAKGNLLYRHEGIANYDTKAMLEYLNSR